MFLISAPLPRCKNVITRDISSKKKRERDLPAYCFLACDHVTLKDYFTKNMIRSRIPKWLSDKNPPAKAGDMGSIPGSGRSPGEENGNLLQYSCLENSMDREAWWAIVHGVAKSQTQLSNRMMRSPSVHLRP